MPAVPPLQVGTLNLASGRSTGGRVLPADELAAALKDVEADVLAVQELDCAQPRSGGVDQAAVVAAALGAADWRAAATVVGSPGPRRGWRPAAPVRLRGPGEPPGPASYGVALVSRRPVRRWSVLALGGGRGRLPVRAPDPRTGVVRTWWIPDEPRAAVAAELDGLTVVATHLSFAPVTAVGQLRRLRRWVAALPHPVVVAGDLNLPGSLPARLAGGTPLVRAATYPAGRPRLQLDHLLFRGDGVGGGGQARALGFGDHLLLTAPVPRGRA